MRSEFIDVSIKHFSASLRHITTWMEQDRKSSGNDDSLLKQYYEPQEKSLPSKHKTKVLTELRRSSGLVLKRIKSTRNCY